MKTIKIKGIDFNEAFPVYQNHEENSLHFLGHINREWQNLKKGKIEEKYCYAAILLKRLEPKRNKLNKSYVFILWLFLCLERPWEKNWKYPLSEKGGKDIWVKIDKILSNLSEDFPEYPDIQTLRKYVKKEDFKKKVVATTIGPSLIKLGKILKFIMNGIKFEKPVLKRLKFLFKFMDLLESQKFFRKNDLKRKFRADKEYFDFLLREAEKEGFIKIKKFSHNSAWIIYNG